MRKFSLLALFAIITLNITAQVKPHKYSDEEIMKLSRHIKELEAKDSLYKITQAKLAEAEREKTELKENLEAYKKQPKAEPVKTSTSSSDVVKVAEGKLADYAKMLHFNIGSSTIRPESIYILDGVADILKLTNASFIIEGHTDNTGSTEMNNRLAQERADNVKNYLVSKGVEANRLSAKGMGTSQPIDTNDTDEGKARNRRVTIKAGK